MSIHSDSDATSVMDLDCWEQGPEPLDVEAQLRGMLERQLPFPRGVILPQAGLSSEAFAALDQDRQQQISEHPSGRVLDGLIMLVRSLLANNIHEYKGKVGDTRLYDVAAHRWGYRRFNDYAVKGHLLAILRDAASGDETYDPTMRDLVHHPLVVQSIWGHPRMAFHAHCTTVQNPDTDAWEEAMPDFLSYAEQVKGLPFAPSPEVPLETFFAARTGLIDHDGRRYVLASNFPVIIPIITTGGRPFDEVRTFDIEGLAWDHSNRAAMKLDTKWFARYVVALVVNLENGDARHYDVMSRPLTEQLATAADEDMRHKRVRAEGNATWSFAAPASKGAEFLFLYRRIPECGTEAHVRPAPNNAAVYDPVMTHMGEYRDPANSLNPLVVQGFVYGVIKDNPMRQVLKRKDGSNASSSRRSDRSVRGSPVPRV